MRSWLDWLCGKAARRQGYKNGYRSGLRAGKNESEKLVREARQNAQRHFETIGHQAREERSKILEEAKADVARLKQEASNKGYDKGYKKGRREGQDSGREEAKLVAYQEAARELGIYVPEHVSEVPAPEDLSDHRLDLNAVLPNIYNTGRGWTVRVQTAEDRVNTFTFSYKTKIERHQRRSRYDTVIVHVPDEQDCLRNLFEAIKFRNRLADTSHQHATLYSECMQHVGRELNGVGVVLPFDFADLGLDAFLCLLLGGACGFADFRYDRLGELLEDFVFSKTLQVSFRELVDDLMSEFDLQL